MPIDLGRRLIAEGVVAPEEVEAALFLSVVRGVHFARVLIDRGGVTERQLDDELERLGGLGLRHVAASGELVSRLPRAMCRRLAALPVRLDPMTGVVDVAAADPLDPHVAAEFGFQFGAPIRVLRAPIGAIEEALRQLELGAEPADRSRPRRATPPFPHGAPQSTIPPPPGDETPIPLVRRIDHGGVDAQGRGGDHEPVTREMSTRRRPLAADGSATDARSRGIDDRATDPRSRSVDSDDEVTDVVLPLQNTKIIGEATPRAAVSVPLGFRGSARAAGRMRSEPPAVSFPSQPPGYAESWADEPTNDQGHNGALNHGVLPTMREHAPEGSPAPGDDEAALSAAPGLVEIAAPRLPRDLIGVAVDAPAGDDAASQTENPPPRRTGRPPLMADLHRARIDKPTLTSAGFGYASNDPHPPALALSPQQLAVTAPAPAVANALPDDGPDPRGRADGGGRARRGTLPPPFGSPDADEGSRIVRAVRDAPNRDELVRLALRGLRRVARRVAVFAVRSSGYQGWACNVEFADQDALKQIHIPAEVPSILATASATAFYLGPVAGTPGHAALLNVMIDASPDVAVVAVRVAGRPAMILLADELDDTMLGTRYMEELARAAAEALSRLLGR